MLKAGITQGLLLLSLAGFSSCTNRNLSPPDTITVVVGTPLQSLNPLYGTDAATQHVNELVHSPLLTISERLVPEPYLAESFRAPNSKTLEFVLRQGCRFASGRELKAEAVEESLRYYVDEKNASPFAEAFRKITRFEKVSDYRFRLHLEKPTPSLPTDLQNLKILDLSALPAEPKPALLPGFGPYLVTSFTPAEVLLERREMGCLPEAASPKIKIKVVRDDLSRFLKLRTGEIDLVLNEMDYRKVERLQKDPSLPLRVLTAPGIGYTYLGLNFSKEKLRDPRVRLALALSFDRESLIRYKSRGMATPARNLLGDQNFYANLKVPVLARDLSRARALLDEAGYFNGSNGKPPLRLSLKTSNNAIAIENARVLAAQAREAGIEIDHQAYEWGIFYSDVKSGNTELYSLRWVGATDPRIYFEVFHSGEMSRNNRTRYQNPEMDKWLELGETELDPVKRKAHYDRAQEIAARDLPYIGLWYGMNVAVFRKELQNVKLHPSGSWRPLLGMRKE